MTGRGEVRSASFVDCVCMCVCVFLPPSIMVYIDSFDDFEKAAERVYLNAPIKVCTCVCVCVWTCVYFYHKCIL